MITNLLSLAGCYSGCQKFVPIVCHCEELSDEAIFWKIWEIASLRSQWLLKDSLSQSKHIFDNYSMPWIFIFYHRFRSVAKQKDGVQHHLLCATETPAGGLVRIYFLMGSNLTKPHYILGGWPAFPLTETTPSLLIKLSFQIPLTLPQKASHKTIDKVFKGKFS